MITIEELINSDEELTIFCVNGDEFVVYYGTIYGHHIEVVMKLSTDYVFNKTEKCSTLLNNVNLYEVNFGGKIDLVYEDLKRTQFLLTFNNFDGFVTFSGCYYGVTVKLSGKLKYMDKRLTNDDYYSYDGLKELLSDVYIEIEDNSF